MKPLSFVVIGSGWRAMFFVRIAKRYPELFCLRYLLCRSEEKAERIRREQGIPTTTSVETCEAAAPDFVVVAVDKASKFAVTKEWLEKGYAVLTETPAAGTLEELTELWELFKKGARLQVAEQYIRYPFIQAGLRAIEEGLLGDPYGVTLSLAHDYHAVSLVRHMLCFQKTSLEARPARSAKGHFQGNAPAFPTVKLTGRQYAFPVIETDSRFGPITDGRIKERTRNRITMEWSNGKVAFYDFDGVQYHSFIRTRHIQVAGMRGEWSDTIIHYLDETGCPRQKQLKPELPPAYAMLETEELRNMGNIWELTVEMEEWQDEYAIATLLHDMRGYLQTGKEPYPLAEAMEDAYISLLMAESLKHPNEPIESTPQPWH